MKYTFLAKEHEELGSLGWQLKGCPGMDPLTGMSVAHDVLEHFPRGKQPDGVAEEFLALGAALWIRGETGYFQRNGNVNAPHVHIASDAPDIFRHIEDEGYRFNPPPNTRKLDDDMEEQLAQFKETVKTELREREQDINEQWLSWATDYIRRGFRKAQKRWPDNYHAAYLFEKIEKAARGPEATYEVLIVQLKDNDVSIFRDEQWEE